MLMVQALVIQAAWLVGLTRFTLQKSDALMFLEYAPTHGNFF